MTENNKIIIKKYPNRRLYNTATSSYITLSDLATMLREGYDFIVLDHKSNKDMTKTTMMQIIFEYEADCLSVVPIDLLKQIVLMYDNSLASVFREHLANMTSMFIQNQKNLSDFMGMASSTESVNNMWAKNMQSVYQNGQKFFDVFFDNLKAKKDDNGNPK